jgi:hypothetical protein
MEFAKDIRDIREIQGKRGQRRSGEEHGEIVNRMDDKRRAKIAGNEKPDIPKPPEWSPECWCENWTSTSREHRGRTDSPYKIEHTELREDEEEEGRTCVRPIMSHVIETGAETSANHYQTPIKNNGDEDLKQHHWQHSTGWNS